MKRYIYLIFCCLSILLCAQTSGNFTINEKLIFHKLEVLETGTDKVLDSFPEGSGMIIDTTIDNKNYLLISIPDVHTYQLQIVNKVVDTTQKNVPELIRLEINNSPNIMQYSGLIKLDD